MLAQEEKPVDLRVRRTRMLLQEAFMKLMAEKSFQSITVQDITERAMVNRATFYDHFVDKYALLEYSIREWFKQTLHSKLPADFGYCTGNLRFLILTVCEFLDGFNRHCLPADKQLFPIFQTQITTTVNEILLNWFKSEYPDATIRPASPELAASVTAWAIYGAALYWSQSRGTLSAEEFVAQVLPLILAGINPAAQDAQR